MRYGFRSSVDGVSTLEVGPLRSTKLIKGILRRNQEEFPDINILNSPLILSVLQSQLALDNLQFTLIDILNFNKQ